MNTPLPQNKKPAETPKVEPANTPDHLSINQREQIKTTLLSPNETNGDERSPTRRYVIDGMLIKAAAIKKERGENQHSVPIESRYSRPQDLHLSIILTKGLMERIHSSGAIRVGKEQLIQSLQRSLDLQIDFERDPRAVENDELREELIKIAKELVKGVSSVAGQAKNAGGAYLSNTSKRLLGQMRAIVEQIRIRSAEDMKIIRQFGFKMGNMTSQDEQVLTHLEALFSSPFADHFMKAHLEGTAEANGLVGNMLETPPSEKDDSYLEWAELVLINIAGEFYRSQINLSPSGFGELLQEAQEESGNLTKDDADKIMKLQNELIRLRVETQKDFSVGTQARIVEKKQFQEFSKAEEYVKNLIARMKLTPAQLKSPDSPFEKMFAGKLFRYIQGVFEGTEMIDEGEQNKSARQFLSGTGYDKSTPDPTEEEREVLNEALSQSGENEFADALFELFNE